MEEKLFGGPLLIFEDNWAIVLFTIHTSILFSFNMEIELNS